MNEEIKNSNKEITENQDLCLFLAGDVMTGRGIDQILPRSVDPVLFEPFVKNAEEYVRMAEDHSGPFPLEISYKYVWGDGLSELDRINPDVRIINLETAITTNNEPWPQKQIHYRMHPGNAEILTEAGIDVCVLGNNHIMDWSIDGLRETLKVLEMAKFHTCGAGLNSATAATPSAIDTKKGRLLIFSYAAESAGVPKTWQAKKDVPGVNFLDDLSEAGAENAIKDVQSYRRENDRVVISIHWGRNWGYTAPKEQRKFAHHLIDKNAADLIFGHSSHHPKQLEVYKNRLILYGCGDLINDYEGISGHEEFRSELTLMYFPTLGPSGRLKSLRMSPIKIHRFRLTKPPQDDVEWLANQLNRINEHFGTIVEKTDNGELLLKWNGKNMENRFKDLF